ncbi:unnamed protein product, partial [Sphenostylis stenocarpa]
VTFGKMFEGVTMLHTEPLLAYLVKVMVDKVCNGNVIVSVTIDEGYYCSTNTSKFYCLT